MDLLSEPEHPRELPVGCELFGDPMEQVRELPGDSSPFTEPASADPSFQPRGISALVAVAGEFSWLWIPILALVLVDWSWNRYAHLQFSGWATTCVSVAVLIAGFMFYTVTGRSRRLADACHFTALWVIFSVAGIILTYLAASLSMPLWDNHLARLDAALGFDWLSYHAFVAAHRRFNLVLWVTYASLLPQIIGSTLYFAVTGRPDRNKELLSIALLSAVITTLVFARFPALGPYPIHADYYPVLVALRAGIKEFSLDNMQGIIQMPSYHSALAVLLIYVYRPPERLFLPSLILNTTMLLSAPGGHHYLVDIIAGLVVGVASIFLITRTMAGRLSAASGPQLKPTVL
jgi:PAP2 superfamily